MQSLPASFLESEQAQQRVAGYCTPANALTLALLISYSTDGRDLMHHSRVRV